MAMKRNCVLALASAVNVFFFNTLPALAAQADSPPAYHAPLLRLAAPDWHELSGKQIEAKFADRDVIVDEDYEPAPGIKIAMVFWGGCPPIETFAADGRWHMTVCSVMLRDYDGHWSVEPFRSGEQLCVSAIDFPKKCRFVWQGPTTDQVIMPLADTISSLGPYFNMYRLKPVRFPLPPLSKAPRVNPQSEGQ